MPLNSMSERESEFLKELKMSLMKYMVGLVFSTITLGIVFYFTTNNRLNNLEQTEKRLEAEKADKDIIDLKLDNIHKAIETLSSQITEQEHDKPKKAK